MAAPRLRDSLIFVPWVLGLFGWFLLLCGVAALQASCSRNDANTALKGAGVGFLSPVQCSKFYAFPWWVTWYVFLVLLMLPILIVRDSIKRFRGGVLGLVTLALVQLFSIANTFTYFNSVHTIRGATLARARVVLAGCITASIGIGIVWLIAAFRDEHSTQLNEKRIDAPVEGPDNTRGGIYENEPEAVSYANPVAET